MNKTKHEAIVYLLLYVDDMLIACSNKEEIKRVKKMLESDFEMKYMGAASKILGMQIKRDRSKGMLFITQQNYLSKVLKRFNMDQSKTVSTPIAQHFQAFTAGFTKVRRRDFLYEEGSICKCSRQPHVCNDMH